MCVLDGGVDENGDGEVERSSLIKFGAPAVWVSVSELI